MKRWIRWKGLIPFVCIIGALVVFWYLFLDTIVERVIESAGTRVVGAKVEIDRADVSLFPVGLSITRMQVTNPDFPMTNAVEIADMTLALDSRALLRKKVIVEEIAMDGVRFNTARSLSGAIRRVSRKKTAGDTEKIKKILEKAGCVKVELPSLQMPDIQKVLADENLESLKIIQEYRSDLEKEKQTYQEKLAALPNENDFAEYRKRIEKLQGKKTSFNALLNTVTDAANLKKDIQADIDRLENEVKSFKKKFEELRIRFSQLSKAPEEDIRRLKDKYTLSPQGMANFSQLLIGTRFCEWWEKGYHWYQRIKPYVNRSGKSESAPQAAEPLRGKGVNIRFPEKNPLPDFLIRQARANIILERGALTGILENVTTDQQMVGLPLTFRFLGRQMQGMQSFNAIGEMNQIRPDHPAYRVDINIQAFEINDFVLSTAKALPVTIQEALADVAFDFSLMDSNLTARLTSGFKAVKMKTNTGASGRLAAAVTSAFSGIDAFDATVLVKGTTEAYTFDVRSDLDKILTTAVGDLVRKEAANFTSGLEKEIMARVSTPLTEAGARLKAFGPIGDELTRRLDAGGNLLKADVFKGVKLPL